MNVTPQGNTLAEVVRNYADESLKAIASKIYDTYCQSDLTDRQILGKTLRENERNADTLVGRETYAWLWAINRVLEPSSVGEIGVRLGYSLFVLSRGCEDVYGWDAEMYEPLTNTYASEHLGKPCHLHSVDTQTIDALEMPGRKFDLFNVDGAHDYLGLLHDLELAKAVTKQGGYILVDDLFGAHYPASYEAELRTAVDVFTRTHGLSVALFPTFRGTALIQV